MKFHHTRGSRSVLIVCFAACLTALILGACSPQNSIAVYITPTPALLATVDKIPTLDLASATAELEDIENFASAAQVQATVSPTLNRQPLATWLGPVIGPGYQLPPTVPAETPTPEPVVPGETAAPMPTEALGTARFADTLPDLNRVQMGIQLDANLEQSDWDEAMYRLNEHLTVGWIKIQLPWRDVQPNGAGELSTFWQRTRLYLEDADRRGFRIFLSIAKAPLWARSTQNEDGPPDDPAQFAAFLTQIMGEVGGIVDGIEVWNEPNLIREWRGNIPFTGGGYMQLFAAAYRAIRAVSPTMPIITAGLAPTGNSEGSRDDRSFMREMYAAGLGAYGDIAVGAHPYSWNNPPEANCCGTNGYDDDPHFFFGDNMRDYRQIMVENGHTDVQLWVTEFGWPTWDGFPGSPFEDGNDWILRNDVWDQGNYTINAFVIGQAQPYIGPMFLWNLNFATLEGLIQNGDERVAYSLVVPGVGGDVIVGADTLTERPLYWMLYDAIRPEVNLDTYD